MTCCSWAHGDAIFEAQPDGYNQQPGGPKLRGTASRQFQGLRTRGATETQQPRGATLCGADAPAILRVAQLGMNSHGFVEAMG